MKVMRLVCNIAADDVGRAHAFYHGVLGLEVLMDQGWIRTYGTDASMTVQLSVASEGGSGTPVPAMSVEVDDLDEVLKRLHAAGIVIEYGPASEPWGVRRIFVRDPFGRLLNILEHT